MDEIEQNEEVKPKSLVERLKASHEESKKLKRELAGEKNENLIPSIINK